MFRSPGRVPGRRLEVPTGIVTLAFGFGEPVHLVDAVGLQRIGTFISLVGGMRTTSIVVEHAGGVRGIEVNLTPLAAFRVLGVSMAEIAGQVVGVAEMLGSAGERLAERLAECPDWTQRVRLLDRALLDRWRAGPGWRPEVAWVWSRLRNTAGRAPIEDLATALGWSRRQVERRFMAEVGLPPKSFAQVARLQRALRIQDTGLPWASVAVEAGYFDQAHFHRTWKKMVGCTPSLFRARRVSCRHIPDIDRIPGQVTSVAYPAGSHSYNPALPAAADDIE